MKSVIPPSFQLIQKKPGNDLLSHLVPQAVPSALKGLTSVFGMGTGVSPSSWLPGKLLTLLHSEKVFLTNWGQAPINGNFALNKLCGQASRSISTG